MVSIPSALKSCVEFSSSAAFSVFIIIIDLCCLQKDVPFLFKILFVFFFQILDYMCLRRL